MIFDDFFTRALLAGIGMAIVAGPLGCFVIWRRLAYFGDTLAHSGLLGVTIGFILNIDLSLSVFVISGIIALLLIVLQKKTKLAGDALLGLLAHSSLAIGLVFIAILTTIRFDLMGLLVGDILSVTTNDIIIIWLGGSLILLVLFIFGIFLGYIRMAYNSLSLPIILHAINNTIAFGMAYFFY